MPGRRRRRRRCKQRHTPMKVHPKILLSGKRSQYAVLLEFAKVQASPH